MGEMGTMSFLKEMTSLCLFMSAITTMVADENAADNSQNHQLSRDGHQLLHAGV